VSGSKLMKTPLLKNATRAAGFSTLLLFAAPALTFLPGCTDLGESPTSSIAADNFYRNSDEVIGGLAGVYNTMRQMTEDYWYVNEVTSDEFVVPTRGSDWLDGGKWLDMHRQTWTSSSPGALTNINNAWVNLFTGIARANVLLSKIEPITTITAANKDTIQAEVRTLRAYYYFCLQDLFGGVPIVTDVEVKARPQNTRAEVSKFIEDELNAVRLKLPVSWPTNMNGRMTRGAADAILASLYLNAEVFTGTVTATGLTKGTQRWADAVAAANRILNTTPAGVYALETNWQKNFTADNYASKEIIMATKELAANSPQDLGLNFMMRTLHYNSLTTQTPWNGFATIAETYNAFDPADVRRGIFLSGPQVNLETGQPAFERDKVTPLNFTVGINDPTQAKENEGIRVMKWPLDPNKVTTNNGNDYGTFRLAEIYLIKAEAENELGQTPQAIIDLNTVRARAFSPAKPTTAVTQAQVREAIYQERLFELLAESKRRQDLIRAGPLPGGAVNRYLLPWSFKLLPTEAAGTVRPAYKILFPIPQTQIETNLMLKQNAGY
jgi:starch-binding outer membrane protein, SusD/RagB family